MFFNHLYPPFNDVRTRRAFLMTMSQEDYMRAYVGVDDQLWKPDRDYLTPGTYNEEGMQSLKSRRFRFCKALAGKSPTRR